MFTSLYHYFKKRGILLTVIILGVFSAALYSAYTIESTEEISDMLPLDEDAKRIDDIRKNIRFNDRIIVIVSQKDSSAQSSADSLIAYADALYAQLIDEQGAYIDNEQNNLLDEAQTKVYDIFYRHLPIFLEQEDYARIDSLMNDSALLRLVESNFKNLISPTGSFTKQYIRKDPLSLTAVALKRLENLKPDSDFELHKGHIFTSDKKNLLLFINLAHKEDAKNKAGDVIKSLETINSDLSEKFNNFDVYIFGSPVVAEGNSKRIKTDILLTVSLAVFLLILILSLFFKRIEIFFILFLPAIFGAAVSIGLIHLIQGSVSLISLGIGSILTGISIDYSLHILNHARKQSDMRAVFKEISFPVIISSLSTATAFFALLFVSSQALRDLGLFAGISVPAAALFALIVLPHFAQKGSAQQQSPRLIERIAGYSWHKSKLALLIIIILTVLGGFFAGEIKFESDMDEMNYMNSKTTAARDKLNSISGLGYRTLFIISRAEDLEQALDANQKAGYKIDSLKNAGLIESFNSVHKIIISPKEQQERIARWNNFFTKERKEFLKTKLIEHGKSYGFKNNTFENFFQKLDKPATPLTEDHPDFISLRQLFAKDLISKDDGMFNVLTVINLKEKNKASVKAKIPTDKHIVVIDQKAFTEHVISILKKDFNRLVYISLSAVFLILLLYYGRIELSIISFAPILISWLWTLGLASVLGIKLSIFNIIISTFIFGLGIDYSIFIMQGLLRNYRYGGNKLPLFKTSVLLSALTSIIAIGVLIFARHPALRSIAFLSIIGITSVVFAAYTLLPIGFGFLVRQQAKKRSLPVTAKDFFFSLVLIIGLFLASTAGFFMELFLRIFPAKDKKKRAFFRRFMHGGLHFVRYLALHIKYKVHNPFGEDFKKPAVIIANHQAHIDIPLLLMLHPKLFILTNDWVQKNFFYGRMVRYAGFPATSGGAEKNVEILKEKIGEGYSLIIFPEGTRSKDGKIGRFHKGAFYYAKALNLEILPIILHGTGDCIPKGEPFLKSGRLDVHIEARVQADKFGADARTQAKNMRKHIQKRYENIRQQDADPQYFRKKLIGNFIYKGPILEHYTRIKTMTEDNYAFFHEQCPNKGQITDIGCGYGYMAYMLNFLSPERRITGLDYDCDKINTANHNISKNDDLNFECLDVTKSKLPLSELFILADVLHYFPKEKQDALIKKCAKSLTNGGKIIIREGNKEMERKHKGTRLSEFFSVKLLKFNKSDYNQLYFTSLSEIETLAEALDMNLEVIDQTKRTSNLLFILTQKRKPKT